MSAISPSTSPAPPAQNGSAKPTINTRSSLGPSTRIVSGGSPAHNLASPRPTGMIGSTRPASELLGGSVAFQTPESEALDQWFENLQSYEATLEEMAAASTDVNFKEELSAIEQWFRVLSEAERTAALYSLLQHSTQVQIRFFVTVLQQMARSDPMTALLSPAIGGSSMQAQMESKLASMGLGSLKSPASPSARTFSGPGNRQSSDSPATSNNNFLSPDSANVPNEAAATLAQQRAKLKATNAQHRISAPGMLSNTDGSRSSVWASNPSQLGQVIERGVSPAGSDGGPPPASGTRPKSTDFTGVANTFRSPRPGADSLDDQLSPMVGGNWASMVNTPLVPMFDQNGSNASLDAASAKLANWGAGPAKPMVLDDVRKFRRNSTTKGSTSTTAAQGATPSQGQPGQPAAPRNNTFGAMRNASGGSNPGGGPNNNFLSGQVWGSPNVGGGGARSPALSNVSSGRFGSDDSGLAALGGLPNFGMGLGSPGMAGLGMGNLPGLGGLGGIGGMGVGGLGMNAAAYQNMLNLQNFSAMAAAAGLNPDAAAAQSHYLAQLAASGGLLHGGAGGLNFAAAAAAGAFGSPGLGSAGGRRGQGGAGGSGMRSPSARGGGSGMGGGSATGGAAKDKEEEVDPALLNDVPGWLRSLRLHKYTPNFEGMSWKDMVVLDEAQLEEKGVAALGARRKMLKTFELVRAKMGIPGGETSE